MSSYEAVTLPDILLDVVPHERIQIGDMLLVGDCPTLLQKKWSIHISICKSLRMCMRCGYRMILIMTLNLQSDFYSFHTKY